MVSRSWDIQGVVAMNKLYFMILAALYIALPLAEAQGGQTKNSVFYPSTICDNGECWKECDTGHCKKNDAIRIDGSDWWIEDMRGCVRFEGGEWDCRAKPKIPKTVITIDPSTCLVTMDSGYSWTMDVIKKLADACIHEHKSSTQK